MCRLMAYIGPPRLIADVVLWPDRSIIKQSYDARERLQDPSLPNHLGFGNLNGDGFGIGWFAPDELRRGDPTPCMYKSITPAWNNENLARLSCKIISPLVFAHVRAAYPGMPVSEQNCHPFQWGRYIWMHNGVVGGFSRIKRRLLDSLSDAAYNSIQSFHSDSAVSFAVFLNHLPDLASQQTPDVLVTAMQAAISAICGVQDSLGITDISLLNFVVSDGSTLIATRFVRPEGEAAATLYYAEGASFDRQVPAPAPAPVAGSAGAPAAERASDGGGSSSDGEHDAQGAAAAGGAEGCGVCGDSNNPVGSSVLCEASYSISYRERGAHVAFVASEPITGSTTDWVAVPKNTVLVITREKGGFLSALQSSLSAGQRPDQRLREVSTCLAAIAQGVHTQSRAWVARRQHTQGQLGSRVPGGGEQPQHLLPRSSCASGPSPFGPHAAVGPGDAVGASADGSGAPCSAAASILMDGLLGVARTMSLGSGVEPETTSMEEEHLLTGHTRSVLALVLDEPSGRLYSSSTDATVRAWGLSDMSCIAVIRGHSKPVTQLQLLGGRLLFTAAGGAVRVWDTSSFACLAKIRTSLYAGAIRSMLVTDDGTIYVGHQDTTVKKYCPLNDAAEAAAAAGGVSPLSPRASAAGAGAGAPGGPVRPPDAQSDPALGHVGPVNGLVACGPYICSAGGDTTVRVWRTSDLSLVRVLRGHRGSVLCLLAVGSLLLSGSRDNTIRVWDLDLDFMCRRTLIGHKDDVVHLDALGLSSSGGVAATPSHTAGSTAAAAASPSLARAQAGIGNPAGVSPRAADAIAAARSPSPAPYVGAVLVASASADGTVRVWSSNWTCLRILTICAPTADWAAARSASLDLPGAAGRAASLPQPLPQPQAAPAPPAGSQPVPALRQQHHHQQQLLALGSPIDGGPMAVVAFAEDDPHDPQPHHQLFAGANGSAGGPADPSGRVLQDRNHAGEVSLNGWARHEIEQQQHLHQQQQHQQQQQQCAGQPRHPRNRRRGRGERRAAAPPSAAALVVAISTHHVVGGYSDASLRLWHMDDVYLADLTEQLVSSGHLQDCDAAQAWHEQLRPFGSMSSNPFGTLNPFHTLSVGGSLLGGSHLALSAVEQQPGGAVAGGSASPPVSPTCQLVGQLAAAAGLGPAGAQQLLSEGSGKLLGVEVLPAEKQRKRGQWCARLRDAGGSSSSSGCAMAAAAAAAAAAADPSHPSVAPIRAGSGIGPPSPRLGGGLSAAAAAAAAGRAPSPLPPAVAAAMAAGTLLCPACGSQDQQLVRALKEFVAIRTVSANKSLRDECLRGAKYLSRLLEALGAEVKMAQPYDGKNPVVLGRLGHNPAHPTVAFYGHYDVQPAEEPDWATNPFEMTAVDGYLCGRGTSDNKGPILAFIYAVKEVLDCWRCAGAAAPINVAFMFEGEEENGSLGFQESLAANLGWFSDAVLVVISNTVWVGENRPCLTYGMRGMVTASLVVSGPKRDLHSGNDGGVFSEPMADLVQLLGGLQGPGGQIAVPGFYTGVRPQLMELAWQGLQQSDEFDMRSYREAIGVPHLTAPPNKYDLLNKRWCQPTLSIVDVRTATGSLNSSSTAAGEVAAAAAAAAAAGSPQGKGAYAHSAAAAAHHSRAAAAAAAAAPNGRHMCCPHAGADGSGGPGLWPSVTLSHTAKHGSSVAGAGAGAAAGAADERSCYRFGPTRFSVIPKVAVGKLSLRFVPEQDSGALIECLKQHIELKFKQLWSANQVELQVHSVGDWWEADPQSQLFKMAERAVTREWGEQPLYVREGGTMPVASLIEKMLGAPALMIPMGQSSDNCHLANERLRRINLVKGKNVISHLLNEVAAAAAPLAPLGGGGGGGGGGAGQ